ncbi:hypothetical protein CGRA01v4_05265 [Colletotrichum graminicola]|nr:hypothetical protein CGRA01v4_05265 [Colletotrichum graminicola]
MHPRSMAASARFWILSKRSPICARSSVARALLKLSFRDTHFHNLILSSPFGIIHWPGHNEHPIPSPPVHSVCREQHAAFSVPASAVATFAKQANNDTKTCGIGGGSPRWHQACENSTMCSGRTMLYLVCTMVNRYEKLGIFVLKRLGDALVLLVTREG